MAPSIRPYPKYKNGPNSDFPSLPEHWEVRRAKFFYTESNQRSVSGMGDLMSVSHITGVTPRKENVTMFLAENTEGHKLCQPADIVINTMWAYMAALGVARQMGTVSPSYGVYRPRATDRMEPDYVDRLLRTELYRTQYNHRSTGITASRLRLYADDFLAIPLICPPLSEQRDIVLYLNHADELINRYISAKKQLIALLEEQRHAVIHQAVTRGLDPNVRLKPSGVDWLGDVPAHWEVRRLKTSVSDVVNLTDRRSPNEAYVALEHIESWTGEIRASKPTETYPGGASGALGVPGETAGQVPRAGHARHVRSPAATGGVGVGDA